MGKVFTITEGLENMGALKTGGQGSVYKGRRIGEIITAVKLLPTPMHTVNEKDKHFIDFQNEVQKLKKVAEVPNPNVVKILSSGFTESGSFPFIEMEFIEGPDLEELLQPPHDPVFTIKEATKVAEQLANALAHCHKVDIKHGDIKSNNIKFNVHTGNYVLLDFGLAVMSDEERRTSLRQAGAIEFMAPEQSEGQMLFQTDVYSFGIILFELLAGTVPFPQKEKGETARNLVRLAHLESVPPDLLLLRKNALPQSWDSAKKEHELQVPQWLVSMVYKCLEKKPGLRFKDGTELYDYILLNSALAVKEKEHSTEDVKRLEQEKQMLVRDKESLQKTLVQYGENLKEKERQLAVLQNSLQQKNAAMASMENRYSETATKPYAKSTGVSKAAFFALLIITAGISTFAAYALFFNKAPRQNQRSDPGVTSRIDSFTSKNTAKETHKNVADTPKAVMPAPQKRGVVKEETSPNDIPPPGTQTDTGNTKTAVETTAAKTAGNTIKEPEEMKEMGHYQVVAAKAYFHNEPDESTRRKAFINPWNNATLIALDDVNGFIYIVYTNSAGQTSKGWLRKKDLKQLDE